MAITFFKVPLWDFSNVVSFGYNELEWPLAMNSLYVTSQMLWPLATMNWSDLWSWIASMWLLKCCGLWLNQTGAPTFGELPLGDLSNVVAFGHNEMFGICRIHARSIPPTTQLWSWIVIYVWISQLPGCILASCRAVSCGIFYFYFENCFNHLKSS